MRRLAAAASLLALAACGDGPSAVTGLNGAISFTYSGAGGGTFNVSGTMPTIAAQIGNSNWGAGFRDTPNTQIQVAGVRTRGAGRYDVVDLALPRLTVGSSTISATCNPDTSNCAEVFFVTNASESDNNFDFVYMLTTGTVAISEISDSRVKGSFTGSGTCFNASGATSAFTIMSGGTFDVPLVSNLPI